MQKYLKHLLLFRSLPFTLTYTLQMVLRHWCYEDKITFKEINNFITEAIKGGVFCRSITNLDLSNILNDHDYLNCIWLHLLRVRINNKVCSKEEGVTFITFLQIYLLTWIRVINNKDHNMKGIFYSMWSK